MNLLLARVQIVPAYTMGRLYVNGEPECWVLEDPVRDGPKVPGETAIPFGTYVITIDYSNRFQREMPHLLNVPGFEGIRIHSGNTTADTHGCLLVGCDRVGPTVRRSREAYNELFPKLLSAKDAGETITIEIMRGAET